MAAVPYKTVVAELGYGTRTVTAYVRGNGKVVAEVRVACTNGYTISINIAKFGTTAEFDAAYNNNNG